MSSTRNGNVMDTDKDSETKEEPEIKKSSQPLDPVRDWGSWKDKDGTTWDSTWWM